MDTRDRRDARSMRHVTVKLTAPEDRMQEMHDDHDKCNIDVDLVELRGRALPHLPHLREADLYA